MVTQYQLLVHTVSNNVTHEVRQVISLFITTSIWGQMSFQHWLHLSSWIMYLMGASTDTSVDTSIEISVDVSIDTRPILDRYMVGMSTECRLSIDRDSVDNKPLYRPTYRPICLHTHVGRYSWYFTDTSPILHRYSTDTWPILHHHVPESVTILVSEKCCKDTDGF